MTGAPVVTPLRMRHQPASVDVAVARHLQQRHAAARGLNGSNPLLHLARQVRVRLLRAEGDSGATPPNVEDVPPSEDDQRDVVALGRAGPTPLPSSAVAELPPVRDA